MLSRGNFKQWRQHSFEGRRREKEVLPASKRKKIKMATLQMQKPKNKNWSSIFPEEQLTETQSMLFVKKLLAVAVSSVTYLRAIFPENAFGERSLEDLKLKILREDNACPGACHVIQWMKGCFDALDKKYLRMILIGGLLSGKRSQGITKCQIYENPEDPDTVIEQYTFKFNYNGKHGMDIYRNDKKLVGATTEEQTKKATVRLLRTLILLSQTLSPLPDDVMMTMKLFYYDDVTPTDYQPPGFKDCDPELFAYREEAMSIRVGEVATPFHTMTLKLGTIHHQLKYKEDEEAEQNANPMPHSGEETPVAEEKKSKKQLKLQALTEENFEDIPDTCEPEQELQDDVQDDEMPNATDKIPETYDQLPNKERDPIVNQEGDDESCESTKDGEPVVQCHCGVNRDDGLMILCGICDTWQHAVCFAILNSENAPSAHTCATCAEKFDGQQCTDPRLEKLDGKELQATCLWRRAMMATSEMNRVTGNVLMKRLGTESTIANHILKRLEKEGYVKTTSKNKRLGKLVIKDKILLDGVNAYFRNDYEALQTDTNSQGSKTADVEEEHLETIVTRASQLKLKEQKQKEMCMEKEISEIKNILHGNDNSRKRAISLLNEADEFEVSDSQDVGEVTNNLRPAKRSKASAAVHSLLV